MTVFDLVFLIFVLSSLVLIAWAAAAAVRGQWARSLRILKTYTVCVIAYLTAGVAVSFLKPQRVIREREPWCFDNWCLVVEKATRTQLGTYTVDLRIFSRAGRISQRAKGAWIYLIDSYGQRYSPESSPSAIPLDVLLGPNESVQTTRLFHVPPSVYPLGIITGHGGPYCGLMDVLVIGSAGCLFGKPTMIKLHE